VKDACRAPDRAAGIWIYGEDDMAMANQKRSPGHLLTIARILALVWGVWWTLFGLASGIGEGLSAQGIVVHAAVPGLVFLFTALAAWRWELVGGALLMLEGLVTLIFFPFAGTLEGFLTLPVPPWLAGILFLSEGVSQRMGKEMKEGRQPD
jgi:hypothetical protein